VELQVVFFLALAYFGTDQSQVGRYLSGKSVRESDGIDYERLTKVPMHFYFAYRCYGICVFSIQSCSLNFNPNKVTLKIIYKEEYCFRKKLDALSEDKKVINLLYIDQLNQDYDNPILRKELVALSTKKRFARSCERNYFKSRQK
jgi:hypothetical protein